MRVTRDRLPAGTGNEICVIVWPVNVVDAIHAKPTVIEYQEKAQVLLFMSNYHSDTDTISFDALMNGSTIESKNGDFVVGARRGNREYVIGWAWANHPNRKMRMR